jgi:hypothetical protein
MRNTPMMANPFEYRQTLWDIIHDGEAPPPPKRDPPKSASGKALPRSSRGMTNRDKAELANFMDEINRIKQERAAEERDAG